MDAAILHDLYEYKEGCLYWKVKRPSIRIGDRAGWLSGSGYRMINVQGKQIPEHRAIFAMHHGYFPYHVDHIDGNTTNNAIKNLRPATKAQNAWNCKLHSTNKSGVRGVYWNKLRNTWNAAVEVNGKKHHIGVYKELADAKAAIEAAREQFYGEYVNHGYN